MEKKQSKRKAPFVGYWNYGVILTYASVAAAVVGILVSSLYGAFWGVVCLFISGFCDAFDGVVAGTRKNRSELDKRFGAHIDSLSDLVAFGIAPIAIGFNMGMRAWYYIPVFVIFALAALIRLAYFDVTEEVRIAEGGKKRTSFEGLPVTNVAVGLPVFYFIATMFKTPLVTQLIMAFCYLLCAFLFTFRFRMPKAGPRGLCITVAVLFVIVTVLCLIRWYVCGVPLTANVNAQCLPVWKRATV